MIRLIWTVSVAACLASSTGCPSAQKQLENVAKDWCMTIRASQVLPVYPLQEDVQPGDVFLVPTSLSTQVAEYEKKGFLPLDQHVKRLSGIGYTDFYADAYWKGTYSPVPHTRPLPAAAIPVPAVGGFVLAPRAAFPSYTFSVDKGAGMKLAIPIQGVPVGMGLMGASSARGSVQIVDAYGYGIDMEPLYRVFVNWYVSNPRIKDTFARIADTSDREVYLRVVSRVFLTGGVTVQLQNLDSGSAGLDVGAPQPIKLPDLSTDDPEKLKTSAAAYKEALEAINAPLNTITNNLPGGSVRIAHASSRSVAMKETFDRPLVIGYHGFDVRVYRDGGISAPIPSFAVLEAKATFSTGEQAAAIPYDDNDGGLSKAYETWLNQTGNFDLMKKWLTDQKLPNLPPLDVSANPERRDLLRKAAAHFKFWPPQSTDEKSPKP